MPLYFLKPIVWNSQDYRKPSGAKFVGGFPQEHGFGHEEWNNSPEFGYEEDGQRFRVFHTEGMGNQPLDEYPGDIFVFMIASYMGAQYLVGVAGGATSLIDNRPERERIVKKLKLGRKHWQQAWATSTVQAAYGNDQRAFVEKFNEDLHWIPTWKCPENLFHWLQTPQKLDPAEITGKKRLITMFGRYQEIDRKIALRLLSAANSKSPSTALSNLIARCGNPDQDMATDLARVQREVSGETTRELLIQARLGQGKFRSDLLKIWSGACAVTGCTISELLRASHIKPWRSSTHKQRLDENNGLLLIATLDALFDAGLISFDEDGQMLVSSRISSTDRTALGLPASLRQAPNQEQSNYLSYHREHEFEQ